jgi:HK97 family phage major capsid protein
MRKQIEQLKAERAKLIADAGAILNRAADENRTPTAEETASVDRLHKAAAEAGDKAKDLERQYLRQQEAEAELAASAGRRVPVQRAGREPNGRTSITLKLGADAAGKQRRATLRAGTAAYGRCAREYRDAFRAYLSGHGPQAVLQTDIASSGGYLAPETFNAELIRELDNTLWMRRLARTFLIDGPQMGTPYRQNRIASIVRGSELQSPTSDTAWKIGRRNLNPHYMTGRVDVSRDLMRSAAINPEQLVQEEIRFEVGAFEEQEFMTGTGAGLQALGIFTASNDGIPTTRDVRSSLTNGITYDSILNAKYAIKLQHRSSPSIGLICHRDIVLQLAKLSDGTGKPLELFTASTTVGTPDTFDGIPIYESEYAPNTLTANSYVAVLGDLRYYWIVDGMGLEIQRLIETGAAANQDQFIYRRKMDAAPVLPEAFARIQLAAS